MSEIATLIERWEREYVHTLNAILSDSDDSPDYWRWNGHAERLRDCLGELREVAALPIPRYRSKEWRATNGVIR